MTATSAQTVPRAIEYGDFQTPDALAEASLNVVAAWGLEPRSVFEPTSGRGSFIRAARSTFSGLEKVLGLELNGEYVQTLREELDASDASETVEIVHGDIFDFDFAAGLRELPDPILICGNPPWVTNSAIAATNGSNLPTKSNFKGARGIEAITGAGNFDISEWIILQAVKSIALRKGAVAMLCKTSVARKVLLQSATPGFGIARAAMYRIDAEQHFRAAVDACLFVAEPGNPDAPISCDVYPSLTSRKPSTTIGMRGRALVSDLRAFESVRHLASAGFHTKWRSGIKHDCAKVMELTAAADGYVNGFGDTVELEPHYLHPLYKGSDIAGARSNNGAPARRVLVPQRTITDDASVLADRAPLTHAYLMRHRARFAARRSTVYRGRPEFAIFGVGDYAFTPWKVAISAMHKRLAFAPLPPQLGVPAMVDDTVYYLPCASETQARLLCDLLNSELVNRFLSSMVFWDDKRPITAKLLGKLDLGAAARHLGLQEPMLECGLAPLLNPYPLQPRLRFDQPDAC